MAEALQPIAAAMLNGNLSASALVRVAKLAYVRAAIDSLNAEGNKKANVSRLSVITGMTRKEIASYLLRKAPSVTAAPQKKQMEHRALKVLRAWTTDPRYKMVTGEVIDLPMNGHGRTFTSLVRSYGGDVTTTSVLRELERLRAVTRTKSGLLHVRSACITAQLRSSARFREFSRLLADFSETAAQLLVERERPLYFEFKELEIATESQAARFKNVFGRRASLLLDGVEHWRSSDNGNNTHPSRGRRKRSGRRMGLGVYLVESRASPGPRFRNR